MKPAYTAIVAAVVLAVAWTRPNAQPTPPKDEAIGILLAAGDIGKCGSKERHIQDEATGKLVREQVEAAKAKKIPVAVLALGDLAYDDGKTTEFKCFHASWSRHFGKDILPVPGNHEYNLKSKAAPYFAHFKKHGSAFIAANKTGYYSIDFPKGHPDAWQLIALNSPLETSDKPDKPDSTQIKWLRKQLESEESGKRNCVLAFWHHFVFSSGLHGHGGSYEQNAEVAPGEMQRAFALLHAHGATAVLSGHDHDYEQFSRQDAAGTKRDDDGVRSFVVGTGGGVLYRTRKNKETGKYEPLTYDKMAPNSERYHSDSFGVLRIKLFANRYEWAFLPIPGNAAIDLGGIDNDTCTKRRKP
jgi:hypothetical protein